MRTQFDTPAKFQGFKLIQPCRPIFRSHLGVGEDSFGELPVSFGNFCSHHKLYIKIISSSSNLRNGIYVMMILHHPKFFILL